MKKYYIFTLVFMLTACGISNKGSLSDASDVFNEYKSTTFYNEEKVYDVVVETTGVKRAHEQTEFLRVTDSDVLQSMFYGTVNDNDEFVTFEYYTDYSHLYSNFFDLKKSFDSFKKIGDTQYFVPNEYVSDDQKTLEYFSPILWFSGKGTTAKLNRFYAYELIEEASSFDLLPVEDVYKALSDKELNPTSFTSNKVFEKLTGIDDDDNYTLFMSLMKNAKVMPDNIGLGEIFEFDELEISLNNISGWGAVENRYSDLNGNDVFFVDVTIKNISGERHGLNMFSYSTYGPDGNRISSVSSYFDNTTDFLGDALEGATQNGILPILYTGDGTYSVIFNNYSEEVIVTFDVSK